MEGSYKGGVSTAFRTHIPERVMGTLTQRVLGSRTSAASSIFVRDSAIAAAGHSMPMLRFIHCVRVKGINAGARGIGLVVISTTKLRLENCNEN